MDFAASHRRRPAAENIVPMINVVFLLLIFFLMSAQITSPPPVDVVRLQSDSEARPDAPDTVFVSADGTLFYQSHRGENALMAVAQSGVQSIRLEADRSADVARFATLLRQLRSVGIGEIDLVTVAR